MSVSDYVSNAATLVAGVAGTLVVQLFRRRRTNAEAGKVMAEAGRVDADAEARLSKAKAEAQRALDDRFERLSASMEKRLATVEQSSRECEDDRVVLREAVHDLIAACDEHATPSMRRRAIESARQALLNMHARSMGDTAALHPPS